MSDAATITFGIASWSAWAPPARTLSQWQSWAEHGFSLAGSEAPKPSFMPPLLRRRASQLCRMSLETAHRCAPSGRLSSIRSVFASRHGESHITQALLEALAKGEVMSPTAFSLSVHNASAGLFTICAENQAPSTTIAAGPRTFCCALLDAIGQLMRSPGEQVLLVVGDELVPDVLQHKVNEEPAAYAFAVRLEQNSGDESLELELVPRTPGSIAVQPWPQTLMFIRFLLSEENVLEMADERHVWRFRKPAPASFAARYAEERAADN